MNTNAIQKITDNAPVVTYGAGASSVVFWGLQVNEICAIVSTLVAIVGLALQFWVAPRRISRLERQQEATKLVIGAVAKSTMGVAERVDSLEKTP